MVYNFSNLYDRRKEGSRKWEVIPESQECEKNQIIPMTVADLDLPTAPEIKKVIKNYVEKSVLGYSKPTEKYYSVVSEYMKRNYQYPVKADWIVPTPGIVPALASSVRAFTELKDGVIVFPPVYNPFFEVIEEQRREIMPCPLELKNKRYEINFDLFEKLASEDKAKLVILCSPHNPSGRVWSKGELTRISKIAEANNLIVISDEIHADMTLEGHTHHLYAGISEEAASHSLVCTSASKSY
ncbi:MAG: aminotransferase class I/II-fold pyridoxal phosphate-dependent enzyme, partial [Atopostipes sp.]|nr:aminotransferase class I/II-fold pyridoxal phosphate-dependent enzyme [Atopostipes sp.]